MRRPQSSGFSFILPEDCACTEQNLIQIPLSFASHAPPAPEFLHRVLTTEAEPFYHPTLCSFPPEQTQNVL